MITISVLIIMTVAAVGLILSLVIRSRQQHRKSDGDVAGSAARSLWKNPVIAAYLVFIAIIAIWTIYLAFYYW